jgi:predicted GIY-YIG superfamily endonuclease
MSDEWHYLYVLKLESAEGTTGNGRWYVGITTDYDRRLREHKSGRGAKCLEDKVVVDDFLIGKVEREHDAKKLENNLTEAIAKEHGRNTVRGGRYVKRKGSVQNGSDTTLSPYIARQLVDIGDPELEKVAELSSVTLEINTELEFQTADEALEWADESLLDETPVTIDFPVMWEKDYTVGSESSSSS